MSNSKPNVIWIFSDQQPFYMLGCNGTKELHTPNIDQLAKNGINFNHAIAGYPLCCPFRGSLLTGLYPHHAVPGHQFQLDPHTKTIAHYMKEGGYHTAYFGKWHVDGFKEEKGRAAFHIVPSERRGGFDTWVGYENNNLQFDSWVHGGEGETAFHYKLPGYETDELTTLFIKHLEEIKTTKNGKDPTIPFFAVLSIQPPHNPYVAPDEYMEHFFDEETGETKDLELRQNVPHNENIRMLVRDELSGSYAMIENFDDNIGRILKSLEELGLDQDTYIFYFSDHGDMHGSHGQFRKTTAYEESIRIPFIVKIPKNYSEPNSLGIQDSLMINHVDIAPTTLGLCGINVEGRFEGKNYASFINNRLNENLTELRAKSVYIQSCIPTLHGDSVDKAWRGIVTNDGWKYVCFEGIEWMLFNLNEDPCEEINLAHNTKYQSIKFKLNSLLHEWINKTGDSFRLPFIKEKIVE